jgi:uncharacterized protein (TIGR00297 family)
MGWGNFHWHIDLGCCYPIAALQDIAERFPQLEASYPQKSGQLSTSFRGIHLIFTQIIQGLALAAVLAVSSYYLKALSMTGAIAALIVGTLTFGFGGWLAALLLILFFVSSSGLSRFRKAMKQEASQAFEKGGRRDLGQVLANGAAASGLALAYGLTGNPAYLVALAGAIAAVNADTWSTELGVLSPKQPRLLTTGARVLSGTSGGVTLVGLLASFGGAGLIAAALGIWTGMLGMGAAVLTGGVLGGVFDSLLGATVQAQYYCPICERQTEHHPRHSCGSHTRHSSGWRWMSNDWVNFTASLLGALSAWAIWMVV